MKNWTCIIFTALSLAAAPARAQETTATGFLEDGATIVNNAFVVKCNADRPACTNPDRTGAAAQELDGYALLVADMANQADAWLTSFNFPKSNLELLDGRGLIRIDQSAVPGAAGYVSNRRNGPAKLTLPLTNAARVFSGSDGPTQDNVFLEMDSDTRARLGDLAYRMDRDYFGDYSGSVIAHELFHTRLNAPSSMSWLEEAMARLIGNIWNRKRGFDPRSQRAMRLDKPFYDNSKDINGFSYGYAKSLFLNFVGRETGSRDRVGYLAEFGKMDDPDMTGMDYLYEKMPDNWAFPRAFPLFVANMNNVIPQGFGPLGTWTQYQSEQDLMFTEIAHPKITQPAIFADQHDTRSIVSAFAADPFLLDRVTLEANERLPEYARLMLARLSLEYVPQPDHLRLVFEHKVIDGLEHSYLTVADGEFDAGYIRVVNVPPSIPEALSIGYILRVAFDPVKINVPACIEVGEETEIDLVDFTKEEAENLSFKVSANAELDEMTIKGLATGPLVVTAVIASHRTRAPDGMGTVRPYSWPDREVTLAESRIAPKGGCSCNSDALMATSNPRMWRALNQFGQALGADDVPADAMAELIPSLMGGELPEDHSTGYMAMSAGTRGMAGEVCADPLTTNRDGTTSIFSLYTPSVLTFMGSHDAFAVEHSGWGGWPANATASVHLEIPVAPQDLEEGRTYRARLAGMQGVGWFPMFSTYSGKFYDFFPWQEAFTGQSETVFPQTVAGTVSITSIDSGVVEGHFRVAGDGLFHDVQHWLREGTVDTFEFDGTETLVPVRATGRFAVAITERSTSVLRAGQFFHTAEIEE